MTKSFVSAGGDAELQGISSELLLKDKSGHYFFGCLSLWCWYRQGVVVLHGGRAGFGGTPSSGARLDPSVAVGVSVVESFCWTIRT